MIDWLGLGLVFDSVVKFFRYFLSFVQCTCYTYSLKSLAVFF